MEMEEFVRLVEEMREAQKRPYAETYRLFGPDPAPDLIRLERQVDDAIGDLRAATWARTK